MLQQAVLLRLLGLLKSPCWSVSGAKPDRLQITVQMREADGSLGEPVFQFARAG